MPLASRWLARDQGPTRPATAREPGMARDDSGRRGAPVTRAVFMMSYANREGKGSDVNVAAHLLLDVLGSAVDGAQFPIRRRQSKPEAVLPAQRVK